MPKWIGNRFGNAVPINPGGVAPSAIYSLFDQYYVNQETEPFAEWGDTTATFRRSLDT